MATTSEKNGLLARYMVGQFRLGYETLALYMAGSLFEGHINSMLLEWSDEDIEKTDMCRKINAIPKEILSNNSLCTQKNVFLQYEDYEQVKNFSEDRLRRAEQGRKRLHNFRSLRNKIIHSQEIPSIHIKSNAANDFITYLWSEIAPDSYKRAYSKKKPGKSVIESLYEHTADYMVRAIDEVEFRKKDSALGYPEAIIEIKAIDFDNLFELRKKLAHLKNYLPSWLIRNYGMLKTDILTSIDTTSAYIWLPLVSTEFSAENRRGVYDCSVSILATPLDLRIYMDFGGFTRDQRKLYFDFLRDSPEYLDLLQKLQGREPLEVFDIDWYSFIFNRKKFPEWLAHKEKSLTLAQSKIKSSAKPDSSPITWNRCLHGYTIPKYALAEGEIITFDTIEPKLRNIILLYEAFDTFKTRLGV